MQIKDSSASPRRDRQQRRRRKTVRDQSVMWVLFALTLCALYIIMNLYAYFSDFLSPICIKTYGCITNLRASTPASASVGSVPLYPGRNIEYLALGRVQNFPLKLMIFIAQFQLGHSDNRKRRDAVIQTGRFCPEYIHLPCRRTAPREGSHELLVIWTIRTVILLLTYLWFDVLSSLASETD